MSVQLRKTFIAVVALTIPVSLQMVGVAPSAVVQRLRFSVNRTSIFTARFPQRSLLENGVVLYQIEHELQQFFCFL